ncbi:hypothetical protein [Polaromonas sp.]|uniref:hypothetical protein n=1 Tax=Polaromonas sp. TaxID=1869339 RepID=UPI00272F7306|nr:hypothetical protein [Polaromonas sp.]MDP1742258.1 hypothetical protein [Polaromonas sp.]
MPEIVLLGSVHQENGRCNSSELARILELFQPDVLFEEIPYQKFLEKNDSFHRDILEVKALYEYLKHHSVLHIPVDTVDPSSFKQSKFDEVVDRVLHAGPDLRSMLNEQTSLTYNSGFEYLNSRLNDRMFQRIDVTIATALEKMNDERLSMGYSEWKAYNSKRETAMVTKVYEFCRLNHFEKGVFLFGSAHRAGLIAKIQTVKRTQKVRVSWKLDWG